MYRSKWDEELTDAERRAYLDQYIMTDDIPSNVKWEELDYGTRSAIAFSEDDHVSSQVVR